MPSTPVQSPTVETVINGLPLRLSFSPEAIREHFDGDDSVNLDDVSNEVLAQVGATALTSDALYRLFHDLLVYGLREEGVEVS